MRHARKLISLLTVSDSKNLVCDTFPGSPLALRYVFRLDEQGKIARLDISS